MTQANITAAHALLAADEVGALDALAQRLDATQLVWASGYLAGRAAALGGAPAAAPGTQADAQPEWVILYGSQTGNGRRVAERLHERMAADGLASRLTDARDFPVARLKKTARLLAVVSTHGDGEPPDSSVAFFDGLLGERAPKLEHLEYAVLALGDSSYEQYCATGVQLDERLAELGARRLAPVQTCDVDYEDPATEWSNARFEHARSVAAEAPRAGSAPHLTVLSQRPRHDRDHPFVAEVLVNQPITGVDSSKDVRHLEISLEDSGFEWAPGDALGVFTENPPDAVSAVLELTGLDAATQVSVDGQAIALGDALARHRELTRLTAGVLRKLAAEAGARGLAERLEALDPAALKAFLRARQLADVLAEHPVDVDAATLVALLPRLAPRLYSIASSPEANPDDVHLTVSVVESARFGRPQPGCASTALAHRAGQVSVYVERNPDFRLPDDPAVPIVMIGAGTGVAPYRAFVQHRRALGTRGPAWLIYGDRTFRDDFLYQLEWQQALKDGDLSRLDVAFSRDGAQKVYVQDRVREHGAELLRWLDDGACLYLCGDAERMAPAVEQALVDVHCEHRALDDEAAREAVRRLRIDGRFRKDVY